MAKVLSNFKASDFATFGGGPSPAPAPASAKGRGKPKAAPAPTSEGDQPDMVLPEDV